MVGVTLILTAMLQKKLACMCTYVHVHRISRLAFSLALLPQLPYLWDTNMCYHI